MSFSDVLKHRVKLTLGVDVGEDQRMLYYLGPCMPAALVDQPPLGSDDDP